MKRTIVFFALFALVAGSYISDAGVAAGVKVAQDDSFNPKDYQRLPVIVRWPQAQAQPALGARLGLTRGPAQSNAERLIEERVMRSLMASGYTMLSRKDVPLFADEKQYQAVTPKQIAKALGVSAVLIISVDSDEVARLQTVGRGGRAGPEPPRFEHVASLDMRLVRMDNHLVLWSGDFSQTQIIAVPAQSATILANMAESIAKSFPPYPKAANDTVASGQ